jgi:hypothetical protein
MKRRLLPTLTRLAASLTLLVAAYAGGNYAQYNYYSAYNRPVMNYGGASHYGGYMYASRSSYSVRYNGYSVI